MQYIAKKIIFFIFVLTLQSYHYSKDTTNTIQQSNNILLTNQELISTNIVSNLSISNSNSLELTNIPQPLHQDISITNYSVQDYSNIVQLIESAKIGEIQKVKDLLDKNVSPNTRILSDLNFGTTVLMCALGERRITIVDILLRSGADPNLSAANKEIKGITPLMIAAIQGPLENVQKLLNAGADVNTKTSGSVTGSTALMAAVGAQRYDIVKTLLLAGAAINAKTGSSTISNITALMLAAETGNKAIVQLLLLSPDTDIHAEDSKGKNALIYAYISGNLEIIQELIQFGAKTNYSPKKLRALIFNKN